jgi:PhzF family phenazine biosynthesis protein
MLDLQPSDIATPSLWVNVGSEQLIVPLKTVAAVQRCKPIMELLKQYACINEQRWLVYVWAHRDTDAIESRFFFAKGGAIAEDPATGSACANLGGWFIATQSALPIKKRIHQGAMVQRPSELNLQVDAQQQIQVAGRVLDLGRGVIIL